MFRRAAVYSARLKKLGSIFMVFVFLSFFVALMHAESADKGAEGSAEELFYVSEQRIIVYATADASRPYLELRLREEVYVEGEEDNWLRIRTRDGAQGYVRRGSLSNVWIRVSKRSQTLWVYRGSELQVKLPVDLGYNYFADKERRGNLEDRDHWRTPDGQFFVVSKNSGSKFYKAFVLNYPTAEDAERGFRSGIITRTERDAIVNAEAQSSMPPMNTALGGWIEIHGKGTGARSNWTQGCIALKDAEMDALWKVVPLGTPVLIEP